jgi:rhodanese-related sulfurtransferase
MAKQHSPGFLAIVTDAKSRVRQCTVQDVRTRLERGEKFHLVDVREDSEFAKAHAVGAIHIGKGVIERDIEKIIPDSASPVVLYCGGGFRSALAADAIQKMGYTNVISMDGGWSGWTAAGMPTESGS